jgi:HEPN domain-containing protein
VEKFKGKYEIILGFVTLVVSLSAFKDELSKINVNLGFANISLSQYFLYSVLGFSLCLYFYIIEHVARDTKIGYWKIFDYLIAIAYGVFIFILISPLLIIIDLIAIKIYNFISQKTEQEKTETFIFILQIVQVITIIMSFVIGKKLFKKQQDVIKKSAENKQIIEIESANKLFESGYYAHSILESFKALESYLQKRIVEKNHRAPKALHELLSISSKLKIIKSEDSDNISALIRMRNSAAQNTERVLNKKDAINTLVFVKEIMNRR